MKRTPHGLMALTPLLLMWCQKRHRMTPQMTHENILNSDKARREVDRARAEMLFEAMDSIRIRDDQHRDGNYDQPLEPTQWYVVDESKA
jgi:hypothetical protein